MGSAQEGQYDRDGTDTVTNTPVGLHAFIEEIYRAESRRVFASLVRLLRDFDLAEEALHEAFAAAVERWGREGIPDNPRAWLVSTGRFKAIDALRRRGTFAGRQRGSPSGSRKSPSRTRPERARRSRTTGYGSSSPAATRPSI